MVVEKTDRFMKTALHMYGMGSSRDEIRSVLLENGASEDEVFLAYKAAFCYFRLIAAEREDSMEVTDRYPSGGSR